MMTTFQKNKEDHLQVKTSISAVCSKVALSII